MRPDAGAQLADLLAPVSGPRRARHLRGPRPSTGLLDSAGVFDALRARWCTSRVSVAGLPALTDDPGRLHRLDPDLEVDLLQGHQGRQRRTRRTEQVSR